MTTNTVHNSLKEDAKKTYILTLYVLDILNTASTKIEMRDDMEKLYAENAIYTNNKALYKLSASLVKLTENFIEEVVRNKAVYELNKELLAEAFEKKEVAIGNSVIVTETNNIDYTKVISICMKHIVNNGADNHIKEEAKVAMKKATAVKKDLITYIQDLYRTGDKAPRPHPAE